MKYLFSSVALMLCIINSNTQKTTKDTARHVTLDTMEVTAPAGAMPYRPSAPRAWDIRNTMIAVTFNWKEKTADAREWIKMHAYSIAVDTLELDAKSMRIDSVVLVSKKGNTK